MDGMSFAGNRGQYKVLSREAQLFESLEHFLTGVYEKSQGGMTGLISM